jgi:hypothetical protein
LICFVFWQSLNLLLPFFVVAIFHPLSTDYTVLEDDETGDFVYADLDDNGNLIPTNEWVGSEDDDDNEEDVDENNDSSANNNQGQQFDLTSDNNPRGRRGHRWRRTNLKTNLENVDCRHFLCTQNHDGIDGENDDNPHTMKEIILSNMGTSVDEEEPQQEQYQEEIYMIGHKDRDRSDEDDETNMRHQRSRDLNVGGQPRILKNLVVMFKFKDHTDRPLPSQKDMDLLMNGSKDYCQGTEVCGSSGSVKTFYQTATHGQLIIASYVADWVTVPYTEKEAADNNYG